ncbi:MAG: PEP-CTERM sorting domain-containing protein [Phycisphaerae bacterium]|nr:PEP-CTERM sorting domain-containing protein [Phycisphaerae bacterium]
MLGLAVAANAAMIGTYVDADGGTGGNTVNNSTGDPDDWWTTENSDSDDLWAYREKPAYRDGDFYECSGTNYEDAPMIKTTISGLTAGTSYEIRVIYASETKLTTDWIIAAGLSAGSLTRYQWGDGVSEETGVEIESGVAEMQVLIGTVVASVEGTISAYIDMPDAEGRCDYDGVTYLEVPEPATMGLLTLGGLGMLIRRKR